MEFKGTKGKWIIEYGIVSDSEELGNIVCLQPEGYHDSMEKWEANALLISKAPEMLEILKSFESDLRKGYSIEKNRLNSIQALIKEATEL